MEQLANLPLPALMTFGAVLGIIFGVRHLGLLQGQRSAPSTTNAAQVAAVIVDPTALNKASGAVDDHTDATKALTKACENLSEHVRYLTAEMDRVREELRIQREIRRDR